MFWLENQTGYRETANDYYSTERKENEPQKKAEQVANIFSRSKSSVVLLGVTEDDMDSCIGSYGIDGPEPKPYHMALSRLVKNGIIKFILSCSTRNLFLLKKAGIPVDCLGHAKETGIPRSADCVLVVGKFPLTNAFVKQVKDKQFKLIICDQHKRGLDQWAVLKLCVKYDLLFLLLHWVLYFESPDKFVDEPKYEVKSRYNTDTGRWQVSITDQKKKMKDVVVNTRGSGYMKLESKSSRIFKFYHSAVNKSEMKADIFIFYEKLKIHVLHELKTGTTTLQSKTITHESLT